MKPSFFSVLTTWLLLFLSLAHAGAPAAGGLTLQGAIDFALENSPVLSAARMDLNATDFQVRASRGRLLPQVTGYAGYDRKSDPVVVVPIKAFGGKPPTFSRDQYRAGLSLLIPIYEGGRLWSRLDMARFAKEVAAHNLSFTRQDLIANVTNVFNQVLYLDELVESRQKTLKALKKARADAAEKLKVGRIAPVDLMRMDTQVAQQEQDLITSREDRRRALHALTLLMGWNKSQSPEITGRLKAGDIPVFSTPPEELVKKAWEGRPDIQAMDAAVKKAEAELKLARGGHLPSLDLVGDYSRHAGGGLHADEEVWTGGLAVSMNIFSGGTVSAQVGEAASRLSAQRHRLMNEKLEVRRQVLDALSRLREARHRLVVAETAKRTAEETYRIEQLRYDTGAGTITDSLLAQAAWQQALANEIGARYAFEKAIVDFRFAMGEIEVASK
jgi:TolC family type I secretion outer membrane protein